MSLRAVQLKGADWLALPVLVAALALPWLDTRLALLVVSGLAVLTLIRLDPIWAPALAVLSVPLQDLVVVPGGITVTQALLPLVILSWLYHSRREALNLPMLGFAGLLWALGLAAAFSPYSREAGLVQTMRWAVVALIYTAAHTALRGPRAAERAQILFTAALLAPLISAGIGLVQYRLGLGPESFAIGAGRARAFGTIGQPNSFAGYLNQAWPLAAGPAAVWLLQRERASRVKGVLPACVTLVLLSGLLVSFSRGGWLGAAAGAAVGGLILVYQADTTLRRKLLRGAGLALPSLLLVLVGLQAGGLLPSALAGRLNSLAAALQPIDIRNIDITDANFAVVERTAHLSAAVTMISERPLLGVGPGSYDAAYERPDRPGQPAIWIRPWAESRGHAHNYYLHIAAEAGSIGLIAYLALLALLIRGMVERLRSATEVFARGCALGGLIMIAAVSGHNLFENLHVLNLGIQFAAVAALATAQHGAGEKGALV